MRAVASLCLDFPIVMLVKLSRVSGCLSLPNAGGPLGGGRKMAGAKVKIPARYQGPSGEGPSIAVGQHPEASAGTARFPQTGSVPGGEPEEESPAPRSPPPSKAGSSPAPLQDSGGRVGRGPAEGGQRERQRVGPPPAGSPLAQGTSGPGLLLSGTPGKGWDGEIGRRGS